MVEDSHIAQAMPGIGRHLLSEEIETTDPTMGDHRLEEAQAEEVLLSKVGAGHQAGARAFDDDL